MKADCHCHTLYSDGALTPVAILDLAKEKNLYGLSITDHDTLAAYPEALPYAKQIGISLISGIEISTEHLNCSVHVLGYAFDLHNEKLKSFCLQQQRDRALRNEKILEKLAKLNFVLSMEEIKAAFPQSTIGRPHIAQLLVAKGYVSSIKKAFDRYLGDKARCYVRGLQVKVEEAIELIQQAGGFAALAHPHAVMPQRHLAALYDMPFDGLEVYHGHAPPERALGLLAIASKKSWLVTGGSDYHGGARAFPTLGSAFTPIETFEIFQKRFEQWVSVL